jgi:hypothetical protein
MGSVPLFAFTRLMRAAKVGSGADESLAKMEWLPVLGSNGQLLPDGVIALDTTITITDQRVRSG